jgi:hypothetical protein
MINAMTGSLLAVAMVLAPSAAFAEGKGMGMGDACNADAQKLCADVEPGEGRIVNCLKEHKDQLSEGCKARWQAKKEGMMANHPCAADQKKLCAGVEPGEGRIINCMKEHEADLSPACKQKLAAKKGEWMEKHPVMAACKADKDRLCAGMTPGDGKLMACMKEHSSEVSEACRDAMASQHKGGKGDMKKGGHKGWMKDSPKKEHAPEAAE